MTKLWLVCYDIADDKRRHKLAKLLEQNCQRVQYSVFECPLDTNILSHLLVMRWLPLLKLSEDNLRVYPLDATAKQQVRVYGSAAPYEVPDYLIL
ncbi:CRISPR-associated endonuclease Cas2 [Westiellopsis prolifica IICB1]|nr:CRISPR-associated endonuclease Cas2 [Westiellopsis prolifica IICB1]